MALVLEKSKLITKIFVGIFWLVAVTPFLGQELMPSIYEKISAYISLLADATLIALGVLLCKKRIDRILILLFLLIAIISTIYINKLSVLYLVNGMRLYIGYLFVIPILRYFLENEKLRDDFIRKIDRHLYVFLWIQVPCMIYQCILYGAYDQVGGSIGWMMSGVITTLIYLISFYLMLKCWDNTKTYLQNIRKNWILIFLLFPSFLNETKISFVFLVMYFFFLIPMDKKFIKRMFYIVPTIFVVLVAALYLYYTTTGSQDNIVSEEYISFYLQGDEDSLNLVELAFEGDALDTAEDQGNDWARGLKLAVLPWMLQTEDYAPFWGFGVSQFKGGTIVERTAFYKEYEWILKGTELQLQIWLIDIGIIGLIWSIFFWIFTLKLNKKCNRHLQLQIYLGLVVIITSIYNSCFTIMPFYIIFMYIVFLSCDKNKFNIISSD